MTSSDVLKRTVADVGAEHAYVKAVSRALHGLEFARWADAVAKRPFSSDKFGLGSVSPQRVGADLAIEQDRPTGAGENGQRPCDKIAAVCGLYALER
jgi:hypothetical protein